MFLCHTNLNQLFKIIKDRVFCRIKENYIEHGIVEFEDGIKLISRFKGEHVGVKLYKNDIELMDLRDFVSTYVQLRLGKWGTSFDKLSEPVIFMMPIQNCEDVLSFLHEVGHACDPEISDLCFSLRSKRFNMELGRMKYINFPEYVDALWEEYQVTMRSEREAWAFALRTARHLERKYNIIILKSIGTVCDIRNMLKKHIMLYEASFVSAFLYAKYTAERIKQIPH